MILLTVQSAGYAIGYLVGILLTPLIYMLLIGGIYFLVKRFSHSPIPFRQAVLNRWVIGSSIVLTLLGLIGNAIN